jgi:serine/threonine-protein kinase RsbW
MSNAPSSKESFSEQFILRNRRDDIEHIERLLIGAVEQRKYDKSSVFAIRLALEEALNNAFKHGNKGDPSKAVRVNCQVEDQSVIIDIQDEGEGFDPQSVPDPTEQENVEIPSGRGLTLMRAFMTEVRIEPPGNRVRMTYLRPPGT